MIPELSASKIAGFIGLHRYQNPDEIFYELLGRDTTGKKKIAELHKEFNLQPYNKVLNEVLKDTAVKDCIACGVSAANRTADVVSVLDEVQHQAGAVLALRHDKLPEELRSRIADEIRGQVSKQRGLQNEEKILNAYESAREVKVVERNTKMVKKDCGNYKLVGRCDGYVADKNRIVDSKDRTREWPTVPLYDEIQLRAYMRMYDASESELIERFPNKTERHTLFTNDDDKWKHIHDLIERGVARLNLALQDDKELKRIVFANTVEVV